MADVLAQIRERMRQNRAARAEQLAAALGSPPSAATSSSGTLIANSRVFDTVSGQEGIVIDGTRENVVVPAPK